MENSDFRQVDPVSPPAAWIGGKSNLAARLIARIDQVPHKAYAEPFFGMGGVFLRRTKAPKVEAINDLSGDVSNFFRVLQRHYDPLMDMLRFQYTGRREFERLLKTDPSTLTDLERAARFLYLQRVSFGGKVAGRVFGVSPGLPARFDVGTLGPRLADINERLAGVIIENLPYGDFIARYDAPGMLFYLDPPYFGCEKDYGKDLFSRADFVRLADQLSGITGHFILSINDRPEIRSIFGHFSIEEVEVTYTISAGSRSHTHELIITPHDMPRLPPPQVGLFND